MLFSVQAFLVGFVSWSRVWVARSLGVEIAVLGSRARV